MENEKDTEAPFGREPWQRLLRSGAGEPPETTDARIRASARRALAPKAARWWLPASLAASFLLAVMIVRWQYDGDDGRAVVTETDVVPQTAPAESVADPPTMEEQPAPASSPQPRMRREAPTAQAAQPGLAAEPEASRSLDRVAVTGSRIGGPERDLQESSARPADDAREAAPAAAITSAPPSSPAAARERETKAARSQMQSLGAEYEQTAVKLPAPDDWYAEIQRLRAAGRKEEADRELERFNEAYPGWLERHAEEADRR